MRHVFVLLLAATVGCSSSNEEGSSANTNPNANLSDVANTPDGGADPSDAATDAASIDADASTVDASRDADARVDPRPGAFRGIPPRPYEGVELPAQGTVPVGASSCVGTPDEPAFMIGDGSQLDNGDDRWDLEAQYCIIANVSYRGRIRLRNSQFVEFRNVTAHDVDGNCLSIGGSDIAVVDSHFHHCRGNNGHGVQPTCGSQRVWVTGNLLEYNDEDGFQSGHQCTGNEPDELYFYGNTCNNNRENCFDLKWTNRAVVSGNLMRRHLVAPNGVDFQFDDGTFDGDVSSGSDGNAVVIGSDGTPNTTFLFDNEYDANVGCVRVEDAVDVYASGETCTNADPTSETGGYTFDKSGHTRLVDSLFRDVPFMITDRFREAPQISIGGNTLEGTTQFRQGENATLNENAVTDQDVAAAYQSVFGRPL